MLRFTATVDLETNTAATPKQIQDALARVLEALTTDRGWRVKVWPVEHREADA